MVLSDGMVHFLKIEIFLKQIYQNYLVALKASFNNVFTLKNLSCISLHANSLFDKV